MFDQSRLKYYAKVLGKAAGPAFAEFEDACQHEPNGTELARRVLAWIQTMHPDDRLEAIRLIRIRQELPKRKEEAVPVISRKARLEIMLEEATKVLSRSDVTAELRRQVAAAVPDLESQLAEKEAEVEMMRETLTNMDADFRSKWAIYVGHYGEP